MLIIQIIQKKKKKKKKNISLSVLLAKSFIPEKLSQPTFTNTTLKIKTVLRQPCLYNFSCFCNCFVWFEGKLGSSFLISNCHFKLSNCQFFFDIRVI